MTAAWHEWEFAAVLPTKSQLAGTQHEHMVGRQFTSRSTDMHRLVASRGSTPRRKTLWKGGYTSNKVVKNVVERGVHIE